MCLVAYSFFKNAFGFLFKISVRASSLYSWSSCVLWQSVQPQSTPQILPSAKHSQYIFKHLVREHLQVFKVVVNNLPVWERRSTVLWSCFSWEQIPSLAKVSLQLMLEVLAFVLESHLVIISFCLGIWGVLIGLNVKIGSGWSLKNWLPSDICGLRLGCKPIF